MNSNVKRTVQFIEAGRVKRCHTLPILGEYTVAEHCYNMIAIAMHTYPHSNGVQGIVTAIMTHDLAERWTGDVPAPVKWAFPSLKKAMEDATKATHESLQILRPVLSERDRNWLRGLDIVELYMWSKHQSALGNTYVNEVIEACIDWWEKNKPDMPVELVVFFDIVRAAGPFLRTSSVPW